MVVHQVDVTFINCAFCGVIVPQVQKFKLFKRQVFFAVIVLGVPIALMILMMLALPFLFWGLLVFIGAPGRVV